MKVSASDAIATVLREHGLPKTTAEALARSAEKLIEDTLEQGNAVVIGGVGALAVTGISARTGRDPRNGKAIPLPARRVVRFKGYKAYRDRLNATA